MEGLFRLSEEQLERIKLFFANSGGVSRVDEPKVLSGIIDLQRQGLRSRGCPSRLWTLENPLQLLPPLLAEGSLPVDLLPMSPMRRHRAGSQCRDRRKEVLMVDATCVKAHRTASSLKKEKGALPLPWLALPCRGLTSKLHLLCHGKGPPVPLQLGKGQCSDFTPAHLLLQLLPQARVLIADKGYDSNKILPTPGARHHSLHPLQREPQPEAPLQQEAYKMGHQVENLFATLKDWRGIAIG